MAGNMSGGIPTDLGAAIILQVIADAKQGITGINQAGQSVKNFQTTVVTASAKMLGLSYAMGGAVRGLIEPWMAAAEAAGAYEKSLAQVTTIMDNGRTASDQYNESLKDLAKTYGIDLITATDALYETLDKGIPEGNAIEFLDVASKTAMAGVTDLDTAASQLAITLNSYGVDLANPISTVSKLGKSFEGLTSAQEVTMGVSDKLLAIIDEGAVRFEEFDAQIGRVMATGAAMGVTLDQLGALWIASTRNGLQFNKAITATEGIFRAFIRSTPKANKLIAEMAEGFKGTRLEAFELTGAYVRKHGLNQAIKDLTDIAGGSVDKISQVTGRIYGLRGIMAAGAGDFRQYNAAMETMKNAFGNTNDMAKTMMETFTHLTDKVESTRQAMEIAFGDAAIKPLTLWNEALLILYGTVEKFVKEHEYMASLIAGFSLSVGGLLGILQKVFGSMGAVGFGLVGIAAAANLVKDAYKAMMAFSISKHLAILVMNLQSGKIAVKALAVGFTKFLLVGVIIAGLVDLSKKMKLVSDAIEDTTVALKGMNDLYKEEIQNLANLGYEIQALDERFMTAEQGFQKVFNEASYFEKATAILSGYKLMQLEGARYSNEFNKAINKNNIEHRAGLLRALADLHNKYIAERIKALTGAAATEDQIEAVAQAQRLTGLEVDHYIALAMQKYYKDETDLLNTMNAAERKVHLDMLVMNAEGLQVKKLSHENRMDLAAIEANNLEIKNMTEEQYAAAARLMESDEISAKGALVALMNEMDNEQIAKMKEVGFTALQLALTRGDAEGKIIQAQQESVVSTINASEAIVALYVGMAAKHVNISEGMLKVEQLSGDARARIMWDTVHSEDKATTARVHQLNMLKDLKVDTNDLFLTLDEKGRASFVKSSEEIIAAYIKKGLKMKDIEEALGSLTETTSVASLTEDDLTSAIGRMMEAATAQNIKMAEVEMEMGNMDEAAKILANGFSSMLGNMREYIDNFIQAEKDFAKSVQNMQRVMTNLQNAARAVETIFEAYANLEQATYRTLDTVSNIWMDWANWFIDVYIPEIRGSIEYGMNPWNAVKTALPQGLHSMTNQFVNYDNNLRNNWLPIHKDTQMQISPDVNYGGQKSVLSRLEGAVSQMAGAFENMQMRVQGVAQSMQNNVYPNLMPPSYLTSGVNDYVRSVGSQTQALGKSWSNAAEGVDMYRLSVDKVMTQHISLDKVQLNKTTGGADVVAGVFQPYVGGMGDRPFTDEINAAQAQAAAKAEQARLKQIEGRKFSTLMQMLKDAGLYETASTVSRLFQNNGMSFKSVVSMLGLWDFAKNIGPFGYDISSVLSEISSYSDALSGANMASMAMPVGNSIINEYGSSSNFGGSSTKELSDPSEGAAVTIVNEVRDDSDIEKVVVRVMQEINRKSRRG
jgi:TP901 family phage tail tape measure protein